jgi:hypothetical protein
VRLLCAYVCVCVCVRAGVRECVTVRVRVTVGGGFKSWAGWLGASGLDPAQVKFGVGLRRIMPACLRAIVSIRPSVRTPTTESNKVMMLGRATINPTDVAPN